MDERGEFEEDIFSGFRGIRWGSHIRRARAMNPILPRGWRERTKIYRREGDDLRIAGIELKDIGYGFRNKRFGFVMATFAGRSNFSALREKLCAAFGPPSQDSENKFRWGRHPFQGTPGFRPVPALDRSSEVWPDPYVATSLEYDEITDEGRLWIGHLTA